MTEERTLILEQIVEIKSTPLSKIISDDKLLWEWSLFLASHLIFVGQATILAEREYWKKMSEFRRKEKSKADAEILANTTDEFQKWRELKYLRDDMEIMLAIMKKLFDRMAEERYLSNKL